MTAQITSAQADRPLGALLAAALVTSGLGYLLLNPGLASAVYVSGVLLLIFVSATGIALRSRDVSAISPVRPGTGRAAGRPSPAPLFKPASDPWTAAVVPNAPPSMVTHDACDEQAP